MNYISSLVRILEMPTHELFFNDISCIKLLVLEYYQLDDFLLIEGYLAGKNSYSYCENGILLKTEIMQINVTKVYPIFFNI